jgi:hypothetical protein
MATNPFVQAVPVQKKLKVLIYGPSGSGKTIAALSWPRPAVVDAESSTDMYRGRPGFDFTVFDTKNIADLERAIQFVREDKGKSIDTLIIDPITVFYDVLKEATARASKTGELGFREWAKINNRMKSLYNSLTNLPVHVVVVARESVEYETVNGELRKVGAKADSDKAVPYIFDFVVKMNTDHSGVIVKSRGTDTLGEKRTLPKVNWSVFEPIANQYVQGVATQPHDDEQDIERLAEQLRAEDAETTPERKVAGGTTKAATPPLKVVDKLPSDQTDRILKDKPSKAAVISWNDIKWPTDFISVCREELGDKTILLPAIAARVGITENAGVIAIWTQQFPNSMTDAVNAVVLGKEAQAEEAF